MWVCKFSYSFDISANHKVCRNSWAEVTNLNMNCSEFGRHFSGHLWHTLWSHSRCELIYNFRYLCKSQSMQEHLRCGILIWTVSSEFWYLCKLYSAQEHTHIVSVNEKVRYPCSQCEYWATINLNQFHEKLKYPYYHCDKHHTQRVMWRDILNQSRGKISTHVINVLHNKTETEDL